MRNDTDGGTTTEVLTPTEALSDHMLLVRIAEDIHALREALESLGQFGEMVSGMFPGGLPGGQGGGFFGGQ